MKLWEYTDYETCEEWVFFRSRGVWRVLIVRQKPGYEFDLLKPRLAREGRTLYFTSPRWLIAI